MLKCLSENSTNSNSAQLKSKLKVEISYMQQQNHNHDSSLCAITNMMVLAANRYSRLKEGKLHFEFIESKM